MPDNLYEEVLEINERVVMDRSDCQMECKKNWAKETTNTKDETVLISKDLDLCEIKIELERIKQKGIKSLAIVLLHSYK